MPKYSYTRPGINLVETTPVPVQYIDDIGRIDVFEDKIILTLYDAQPGETGKADHVVIARIAVTERTAVDIVQVLLSVLAQAGLRVEARKPLLVQ